MPFVYFWTSWSRQRVATAFWSDKLKKINFQQSTTISSFPRLLLYRIKTVLNHTRNWTVSYVVTVQFKGWHKHRQDSTLNCESERFYLFIVWVRFIISALKQVSRHLFRNYLSRRTNTNNSTTALTWWKLAKYVLLHVLISYFKTGFVEELSFTDLWVNSKNELLLSVHKCKLYRYTKE